MFQRNYKTSYHRLKILKKESIKILHQGGAKFILALYLWEKGYMNGFSIVKILPIFP